MTRQPAFDFNQLYYYRTYCFQILAKIPLCRLPGMAYETLTDHESVSFRLGGGGVVGLTAHESVRGSGGATRRCKRSSADGKQDIHV